MILRKAVFIVLSLLFLISGCKQNLALFEGNFRSIKKIDSADGSEILFKKESRRYKSGFTIKLEGKGLIAIPVKIDENGKVTPVKGAKQLQLKQTDEDIFQFKKTNGSLVLTFIFSEGALRIDEYTKQNSGSYSKESQTEFQKL